MVVAGAKVALQFSLPHAVHESVLDFVFKAFEIAFVCLGIKCTQAKRSAANSARNTLSKMRSR